MIDVVIPVGPNDRDTAKITAMSIQKNILDVRTIWIVSHEDLHISGTTFVNESELNFKLQDIRTILKVDSRAGWYFQQLIKLYIPTLIPSILQHYLVVDADTFFLRPCRFVEDGRPVFNLGNEFHQPYFDHMQRLYPSLMKPMMYSGITHTLLYDRRWLKELISLVEEHHKGKIFWKIYLDEVDPDHKEKSGAAENELYFTYCILAHIRDITIKTLKWTDISSIDEINNDLDYVSLHWYRRQSSLDLSSLEKRVLES
jgi:hypothetical protein